MKEILRSLAIGWLIGLALAIGLAFVFALICESEEIIGAVAFMLGITLPTVSAFLVPLWAHHMDQRRCERIVQADRKKWWGRETKKCIACKTMPLSPFEEGRGVCTVCLARQITPKS